MNAVTAVPQRPSRRAPAVPSGVLGILILTVTEAMFFAGLMSAHTIVKASAVMGIWPPEGQPRLPAGQTAFNTACLFLSGAALLWAHRTFAKDSKTALRALLVSTVLGTGFVALQGREWVALIAEGLTLTSSSHGGFFYVIVGLHAAHALVAIVALTWATWRLRQQALLSTQLWAVEAYWYFVIALWPIIYVRGYF